MKLLLVAGARPNFMKIAPILHALNQRNQKDQTNQITCKVVHTGQHYDRNMSDVFFRDLKLPAPDICLGVGSGTHAQQTAGVMVAFEKVLHKENPAIVMVVGDINSTLAAALATVKFRCARNTPGPFLAHVEAGLRSFDRTMPEEINRLLTDTISDLLFTPSVYADHNLIQEGIDRNKIHCVGNIMADSFRRFFSGSNIRSRVAKRYGLKRGNYILLTLHRPGNVDDRKTLMRILKVVAEISSSLPVIFPCHPRTRKNLRLFNLEKFLRKSKVIFSEPLGYLDFSSLLSQSRVVLTDSGGVQSETTIMNIPCLVLRESTEWLETLDKGSATLVGINLKKIKGTVHRVMAGRYKKSSIPPLWDGRTARRIVQILRSIM